MFIISWFWDVLIRLGLAQKTARIVVLGLDNAGKTTLLHMLKTNRFVSLQPTIMPTCEEFIIGDLKVSTYDLGGHPPVRRMWRDYLSEVDAIIFVVDSVDVTRFPECKTELDAILGFEEASNVPLLILGNKIDVPGAVSEEELTRHLGLGQKTGKGGPPLRGIRPIEIFMSSVVKRQGYAEAFRWISQCVSQFMATIVPCLIPV
ncbi:ADP-ribosylation factor family-domain-containing protein [Mycena vulgaris]|nr:ADP-ribosylation factor family-domain-containing protein [Mycena vulgaris]